VSRLFCFCLGAVTGVLGTLAYQKIASGEWRERAVALGERLSQNVSELESRIEGILEQSGGESAA
jgi:hypothetical protein